MRYTFVRAPTLVQVKIACQDSVLLWCGPRTKVGPVLLLCGTRTMWDRSLFCAVPALQRARHAFTSLRTAEAQNNTGQQPTSTRQHCSAGSIPTARVGTTCTMARVAGEQGLIPDRTPKPLTATNIVESVVTVFTASVVKCRIPTVSIHSPVSV